MPRWEYLFLLIGVGWGTASRWELFGIAATAAGGFITFLAGVEAFTIFTIKWSSHLGFVQLWGVTVAGISLELVIPVWLWLPTKSFERCLSSRINLPASKSSTSLASSRDIVEEVTCCKQDVTIFNIGVIGGEDQPESDPCRWACASHRWSGSFWPSQGTSCKGLHGKGASSCQPEQETRGELLVQSMNHEDKNVPRFQSYTPRHPHQRRIQGACLRMF